MPDQPINFSAYQRQVLNDLALDAWYLQPLSRDKGSAAEQHMIADIVDAIHHTLHIKTPACPAAAAKPAKAPDAAMISQQRKTQAQRLVEDPVVLSTQGNFLPPTDTTFQLPYAPVGDDWQAVTQAVNACESPVISTVRNADIVWVTDFPSAFALEQGELLDKAEKTLLSNILQSIGFSDEQCYVTALLKQPTRYRRDPDEQMLQIHLPILLAELALLAPKRILLSGRITTQVMLSTKAPLSQLMHTDYTLLVAGKSLSVRCLPSLHYYLALPSQKAQLWQWLKTLQAA